MMFIKINSKSIALSSEWRKGPVQNAYTLLKLHQIISIEVADEVFFVVKNNFNWSFWGWVRDKTKKCHSKFISLALERLQI